MGVEEALRDLMAAACRLGPEREAAAAAARAAPGLGFGRTLLKRGGSWRVEDEVERPRRPRNEREDLRLNDED